VKTVLPPTLTGKPDKFGAEQHPGIWSDGFGWLHVKLTAALAMFT
jgi:hypothetical protein